jgi:hypothetical protein
MRALLVAGNFAEARLAMDNIDEPVEHISEGNTKAYYSIDRYTPIYMYGTYEDRKDFDEILKLIKLRALMTRNVMVKDGLWKGRL